MANQPQQPIRYPNRIPPTVLVSSRPKVQSITRAEDDKIFTPPPINKARSCKFATLIDLVVQVAHGRPRTGSRICCSRPNQWIRYYTKAKPQVQRYRQSSSPKTIWSTSLLQVWLDGEAYENDYEVAVLSLSTRLHPKELDGRKRKILSLRAAIRKIHAWVDGEVYENSYVTLITNLDLEARALEQFEPRNLTQEEREDRATKISSIRAAIRSIQAEVRNAYASAYDEAVTTISTLSAGDSEKKVKAQQMRDFCLRLKDRTIVSMVAADAHADDADDLLAYKPRPLAKLSERERLKFWRDKITSDVIASSIGRGCAIVDVRSLLKDRAFVTMLSWYMPRVCDIIHHRMIYPADQEECMRVHLVDVTVREAIRFPRYSLAAYESIRSLDEQYRARKPNAPTWADVPVFESLVHLGSKVGDNANMVDRDRGEDSDEDHADIGALIGFAS